MIIQMNLATFEMDVRALAMAFFSGEELQMIVKEEGDMDEGNYERHPSQRQLVIVQNSGRLHVIYEENDCVLEHQQEPVCSEDRKERRNQLKRMMYRVLSRCLSKELPWGTLTGIRPVKMVRTEFEQGVSPDVIRQNLKELYYVSDEKTDLMFDIARTELDCLKDVPYKEGYSLYVGIPFCPSTCAYCSFTSYSLGFWKDRVDEYVDYLCREIDVTVDLFKDKQLCSIYVGGGTPTTLNPEQLDKLLTKLNQVSRNVKLHELTVEAGRPDSVTREKLQVLKNHGVTRISINPQTMKQETLDTIGRKHTVEQTVEAYRMARELGFDNINMDLIMGLPGENIDDVRMTMERIKELAPDSLTVHSLAIKRAARLRMFKEDYQQYESVNTQEMIDMVASYAKEMDLVPYYLYRQKNMAGNFENVGYSKKDKIGIYNILIMEEMQTIAAAGAGASTKIYVPGESRAIRVENVKEVQTYMTRFEEMLERKREAVQGIRK